MYVNKKVRPQHLIVSKHALAVYCSKKNRLTALFRLQIPLDCLLQTGRLVDKVMLREDRSY